MLPCPSPPSFSTKFPVATAPSTQAARRVWPDKPASVSQTQRPICLGTSAGPHSARCEAVGSTAAQRPWGRGVESQAENREGPSSQEAILPCPWPHQEYWAWCLETGLKLSRSHTWKDECAPNGLETVIEQLKQMLGKTLEHTEQHQGRILEQP